LQSKSSILSEGPSLTKPCLWHHSAAATRFETDKCGCHLPEDWDEHR